MQYALVDNIRQSAFYGGKGKCPLCSADVIAKCGNRLVHHWAHARLQNCDPWWENETAWHRKWKNMFPEECREVPHTAEDGEIHRADVKTPSGVVIEFQHSAISDTERLSREQFYKNLVWVVDGKRFKQNFDIFHLLPSPNSEFAKDLVWFKATRQKPGAAGGIFFRISENPNYKKDENVLVRIQGIDKIQEEVNKAYEGHHQYDWIRPHRTWLNTPCPVYIDFGDNYLARLESYGEYQLPCVRLVSKKKFLHDAMVETCAIDIGRHFNQIEKRTSSIA